jgi:hypothetical protein
MNGTLGVLIQKKCKCSKQCLEVVSTAYRVLAMIKKSFIVRDKDVILQLYKPLVRPHLEHSIQVWRPHYQKDIDLFQALTKLVTRRDFVV